MVVRPTSTEVALGARLSALAGTWLELRCPRHQGVVLYPVDLLRRQYGDRRLGTLLPRFRCRRCGGPPSPVHLCETPQRVPGHGAPPGWSVELGPPDTLLCSTPPIESGPSKALCRQVADAATPITPSGTSR